MSMKNEEKSIRVSTKTHETLKELKKKTGIPIKVIVERLLLNSKKIK